MAFTFYSICVADLSTQRGERGITMIVKDLYVCADDTQTVGVKNTTDESEFFGIFDDMPLHFMDDIVSSIHCDGGRLYIFCE